MSRRNEAVLGWWRDSARYSRAQSPNAVISAGRQHTGHLGVKIWLKCTGIMPPKLPTSPSNLKRKSLMGASWVPVSRAQPLQARIRVCMLVRDLT
jgi:hypothetical protein